MNIEGTVGLGRMEGMMNMNIWNLLSETFQVIAGRLNVDAL